MRFLAAVFAAIAFATTGAFAETKVLRVAHQSIGGDAIDPAQLNSVLVAHLLDNLIEPMLRYDYLARPLRLVPNTVDALPEASEGGRVYTCRVKRGVFFAPDPAFKGKPRELTAGDYAYSFRRLFDPKYKSSQFFIVDGKIAGADALRAAALAGKVFDYDKPIPGLQVLDRYTLRITLNEPDLNFLHVLAQQNLGAVAREVVEAYGDDVGQHPVGTGPYYMVERHVGPLGGEERYRSGHGYLSLSLGRYRSGRGRGNRQPDRTGRPPSAWGCRFRPTRRHRSRWP